MARYTKNLHPKIIAVTAYSIFLKLQRIQMSDFPIDEVIISIRLNGRDVTKKTKITFGLHETQIFLLQNKSQLSYSKPVW